MAISKPPLAIMAAICVVLEPGAEAISSTRSIPGSSSAMGGSMELAS